MVEAGVVALYVALAAAAFATAFPRRGRFGLVVAAAALSCSAVVLGWALLRLDLSYAYVADHARTSIGAPYRLAGLWGGASGSLLLFTTMVSMAVAGTGLVCSSAALGRSTRQPWWQISSNASTRSMAPTSRNRSASLARWWVVPSLREAGSPREAAMADTDSTTVRSAEIVPFDDPVIITERVAVAAFLAGYANPTRRGDATDLRVFAAWCHDHDISLLNVKRPHLEMFARWMEQEGRMASTIDRRLSTLSSFYKYCQLEDIVAKNPALNVRRPKVHAESRTLGSDRNELGALLVQAGLGAGLERAPDL